MLSFTEFLYETMSINEDVKKMTDLIYQEVIKNINILKTKNILTLKNFIQDNYPDVIVFNDTLIFKKSNNFKAGIVEQQEKNNIISKLNIEFNVEINNILRLKQIISHELTHVIEHLYSKELSKDWELYKKFKEHQKKYQDFKYWIDLSTLFYETLNNELRSRTSETYELLKSLNTKDALTLKNAVLNSPEYKKLNDILKLKANDIINFLKQKYPDRYEEILSDFMLNFYKKPYSEKNFNSLLDSIKHKVRRQLRKLLRLISNILYENDEYLEEYDPDLNINYYEYIQNALKNNIV